MEFEKSTCPAEETIIIRQESGLKEIKRIIFNLGECGSITGKLN